MESFNFPIMSDVTFTNQRRSTEYYITKGDALPVCIFNNEGIR